MRAPRADTVDVEVLATEGASLERRYSLDQFERLADVLVEHEGAVTAWFRFLEAADGLPACELRVEAEVSLRCQRCLQPVRRVIGSVSRLAFVSRDEDATRVPAECEAVTGDVERIDLVGLVEDELLLSLPVVALHAEGTPCAAEARGAGAGTVAAEAAETHRPFARLKDLLEH